MTRNLKVLGLAMMALFAFSVVAASVASAQNQGTLTSTGPVTLTGTEIEPTVTGKNAFTALGGRLECPHTTYTGHKYEVTPHQLIPVPATTATVTPHFATKCRSVLPVLGERAATVTVNGCDLVLHIGETTGGVAGTYGVTVDLVCPVGKDIEIHIYKLNPVSHALSEDICTLTFKPQNGIKGAHLKHTVSPADDIDLEGTFENILFDKKGTACGEGVNEKGKLDVNVTITGHNAEKAATAVTITDP